MMEYISVAPTLTLLIAIFWIIFAPIFFYKIFQPCWECHGFESTMAHEVGHVLGFHHPDAEWRHNLRADAPSFTCILHSSTDAWGPASDSLDDKTWTTLLGTPNALETSSSTNRVTEPSNSDKGTLSSRSVKSTPQGKSSATMTGF